MEFQEIITSIKDNTFSYGETVYFYEDGDLRWYIKNQGLCEIGFKFKGSFAESELKNTISVSSWREAIKRAKEIVSTCKKVDWTIFADVYDKDDYTYKREKLTKSLGLTKKEVRGVISNNTFSS